jgi:hypothetical protein
MQFPYVVVANDGVFWVGLAENEAHAWQIALGFPDNGEIAEKKRQGWCAVQAQLTWKNQSEEGT